MDISNGALELTREQANAMIRQADTAGDNDGRVSWYDFQKICADAKFAVAVKSDSDASAPADDTASSKKSTPKTKSTAKAASKSASKAAAVTIGSDDD